MLSRFKEILHNKKSDTKPEIHINQENRRGVLSYSYSTLASDLQAADQVVRH